jgi:hypothetical protein
VSTGSHEGRHDRSVNHSQVLHAKYATIRIEHGSVVIGAAYAARAAHMVCQADALKGQFLQSRHVGQETLRIEFGSAQESSSKRTCF